MLSMWAWGALHPLTRSVLESLTATEQVLLRDLFLRRGNSSLQSLSNLPRVPQLRSDRDKN